MDDKTGFKGLFIHDPEIKFEQKNPFFFFSSFVVQIPLDEESYRQKIVVLFFFKLASKEKAEEKQHGCRNLVSISPTFYTQLLHSLIP